MRTPSLTIKDNRTGREYEVEIKDGSVRALDLRQIKVDDEDFGLITYDPGFSNTGSCRSTITYIDGQKGILRYRGYPIEELAERVRFWRSPIWCFTASFLIPTAAMSGVGRFAPTATSRQRSKN